MTPLHRITIAFLVYSSFSTVAHANEFPVPIKTYDKPELLEMGINDLSFSPDSDQHIIFTTKDSLYQLNLNTEEIEFLGSTPLSYAAHADVQFQWLYQNQVIILYHTNYKGAILRWPSLEVINRDIFRFMIPYSKDCILYQKSPDSEYYLLDLENQSEELLKIPAVGQVFHVDKENHVLKTVQSNLHSSSDSTPKSSLLCINTWNYATTELLSSVTFEDKYPGEDFSGVLIAGTNIRILDTIVIDSKMYLLGVRQIFNTRYPYHVSYRPMLWDVATGQLLSSTFQDFISSNNFYLTEPLFGFSSNGQWLVITTRDYRLKLISFFDRLQGNHKQDIELLPKGNFAFSKDGLRMVILDRYSPGDPDFYSYMIRKIMVLELDQTSIDDYEFYEND